MKGGRGLRAGCEARPGERWPSLERHNVVMERLRAVVLVEGVSDKVALETLAIRRGRDLAAEGVSVVAIGGAQAIGRFLGLYGPLGSNVGLAGLCDAGEERAFRRPSSAQASVVTSTAPGWSGLASPRARGIWRTSWSALWAPSS